MACGGAPPPPRGKGPVLSLLVQKLVQGAVSLPQGVGDRIGILQKGEHRLERLEPIGHGFGLLGDARLDLRKKVAGILQIFLILIKGTARGGKIILESV